jgi:hypothetical protein
LDTYYLELVEKVSPEEEILNLQSHIRIGWGFDGTIVMYSPDGENQIGEIYENWWTGALFMQPLPKFLRKFKGPKRNKPLMIFLFALNTMIFRPNYFYRGVRQFLERR